MTARFLLRLSFVFGILFFGLAQETRAADTTPALPTNYNPTEAEFAPLQKAVAELLQSGDTSRFATNVTADVEAWQSILSTNPAAGTDGRPKDFTAVVQHERQRNENSARTFLDRAKSLHLNFSKGDWTVHVLVPKEAGSMQRPDLQAKGETMPWINKVDLTLTPTNPNSFSNGEFKAVCEGLVKFPGGWRCYNGIRWSAFPTNLADNKTLREMAILEKMGSSRRINDQDDPALTKLAASLVKFISQRDLEVYRRDALVNSDRLYAQAQRFGRNLPPREEFQRGVAGWITDEIEAGRAMVKQMEDAGIDLKDAEIRIENVSLSNLQSQGPPGSVDGLSGYHFAAKLAVTSKGNSRTGKSLSGEYILAAKRVTRFEDDWLVGDGIRWEQFPPGVVDDVAAKQMQFENYVAEHDTLPPETPAPEIEFITLDGEKKMKLSDMRGKIVVLDFWATWCGPCQEPMAKLQKIRQEHPDWQDKVAIIPLSIDDAIVPVRRHVEPRGWTNTFNVWAGEGGWHAAAAKAFRVTGVPTTYIIDAKGNIVTAGHPAALPIEKTVDRLLTH
jgi:thiol-disulfide isomerase/thioredoxin